MIEEERKKLIKIIRLAINYAERTGVKQPVSLKSIGSILKKIDPNFTYAQFGKEKLIHLIKEFPKELRISSEKEDSRLNFFVEEINPRENKQRESEHIENKSIEMEFLTDNLINKDIVDSYLKMLARVSSRHSKMLRQLEMEVDRLKADFESDKKEMVQLEDIKGKINKDLNKWITK
ncbi:hypothetical protein CXF72_13120 [Psychromonas sp. MB-3u-54]|uniref:OST-HTH/LOTUS domain-containing protein n=1 Tax=Psychromonas sp. MB-3u-54 TaxID=2058319 RepID=UPI000C3277A0|nr:OST-HTH/LOTUS domain-containing protein [Psychromonas sp. MB-3u-54]PKH02140.1 hypothetical protein CXF72_13120 [Psychromonas sp. MB-3u-54]